MNATSGNEDQSEDRGTEPAETSTVDTSTGLPTYVKVLLALALLTIVFIVVLDLLIIAGGL